MKNNLYFIGFLFIILVSCSTTKQLEHDLEQQSDINNYFRGFVVYDTKTNKEIINYNGAKYFTPASNTKLFTFYTAYRTFKDSVAGLEYEILNDSLIIKGTADPSLLYGTNESKSISFLNNAKQNIYLVDEVIAEKPLGAGWSWDDYAYYYMPEKNLFPIYGNILKLSTAHDSIVVYPNFFENTVKVADDRSQNREVHENVFYVSGTNQVKDREIPFKTSNQLVADLLSDEIGSKVTLISNSPDYNFKTLFSVKYDSLYKKMLHISDNFIAEQLMLQVGYQVDSTYSVAKAIQYSLDNYLQDIPQKPRWVDGSGLSRYNLFTPESYVFLLKKMYKEIPRDRLFSYLPAGGISGTLKNYFENEVPYIYAKSGTLSNNYNLSGYLVTKKGTVLIFSFMNNHYKGSASDRKKEMALYFKKLYEKY